MKPKAKIAKLLRTSEEVILDLERKMEGVSGKKGVIEKIVGENEKKIKQKLTDLAFGRWTPKTLGVHLPNAEEVYIALIEKTKQTDQALFKHFHQPDFSTAIGCQTLINATRELTGDVSGFYLKREKAAELLRLNPPKNIMAALGYGTDIEKMLAYEDIFEIFSALRFIEDETWLNDVFFRPYENLKEVDWHSNLFKEYSSQKDFAKKLISALKVEVSGLPLPDKEKMSWRIVAKYLGKKDPNDPRLFEPHTSPEAWHFTKTNRAIEKFSSHFPELELDFWRDLDWAGEYFIFNGEETLISFGLYDNGIALLKQGGFESKYLYHQQEALWNKIFMEYMGEEMMDKLMREGLERGYITL